MRFFCGKLRLGFGSVVHYRAIGSAVERFPDDKRSLTYKIRYIIRVNGSVVERVPDKNKVEGSIPSSPTTAKYKNLL